MPHHTPHHLDLRRGIRLRAAGAMVAMFSVATAFAAGGSAGDAKSRHERESAACMDGSSQQDRATCLQEAGAALDEARRGRLDARNAAHEGNATARCNALPAKDRSDCVARINGAGTTSGSVRDGGIYRELVTRTPAPPPTTSPIAPQE